MKHEYSLAHLTVLSLTPPQLVDVAARTGYDYVGVRITRVTPNEVLYDLARDRAMMKETKARLDDTGIGVHDVELFRMDPSLDAESFLPQLEATAELGSRNIIAQLPDPDRGRATERFARICDLARPLGIFVSLEFPHWTETGNLREAARVVRAVNRSNAGILVDMLHFGRSDSSLDELARLPREWFRFAHVCDAAKEVPPTMAGIIRTARDERQFPGEGGIEVCEILARLPQDIPYALEIPRNALTRAVGAEEVARLALVAAKSYLDGPGVRSASASVARPGTPAAVPGR
ncbi:MAG: sugar phosphate isomerase/epimerase [Betaproteobacteria bacterium]|nr:sugar phosphate isomerase/epimerase [Betaproteobacteria bacterium]MDE2003729.1 sugar phosphate isomerase/epimerase [Betaproteobacteria bacterium]MDE2208504.1 sugar phosphate isomerase/epimerase [Betaproteobacteria bacterium]MDE2358816.1 sugar phosphate isomerase/epimerase [Betaproteobacteria bacterium]